MTRSEVVTQDKTKKMTELEVKKMIEKMKARDSELVVGIFKNLENPRGTLEFSYKYYPGEELQYYQLMDGERYKLPRGVARHLNINCYYKEYTHLPGELGQAGVRGAASDGRLRATQMQMARKLHRYAFHSLEFMDDDIDMKRSNLLEVTVSP